MLPPEVCNLPPPVILDFVLNTVCYSTIYDFSSDTKYSVEEVVEHVGFGKYQVLLLIVAGFSWVSKYSNQWRNLNVNLGGGGGGGGGLNIHIIVFCPTNFF